MVYVFSDPISSQKEGVFLKRIGLLLLSLILTLTSTAVASAAGGGENTSGIDWLLIRDIGVIVAAGIGFYFLQRGKKEAPKEKAIDWFEPKEIDEDGFIVTQDDRYMMMLRVQPISFALKSPQEQKMIWSTFREWLSMLSHPVRFRIQSHPYDLQEYFYELRTKAMETGDVMNIQYVQEQEAVFNQVIQDQKIQDQRCYIILETDYRYLNDVSGVTQSPLMNELLQRFNKSNQGDNREIAKQELLNSLRLTESTFSNIKLMMWPMNRQDVIEYLHGAINRETSSLVTMNEFVQRVAGIHEERISMGKTQMGGSTHVLEAKSVTT